MEENQKDNIMGENDKERNNEEGKIHEESTTERNWTERYTIEKRVSDQPIAGIRGEPRHRLPEWYIRTRNLVYYFLGVVEVLLAFRLIFKILGANARNGMVQFIYSVTSVLIAPFEGIFAIFYPGGASARFVFEPATIIAMIVYALIARGIVSLLKVNLTEAT